MKNSNQYKITTEDLNMETTTLISTLSGNHYYVSGKLTKSQVLIFLENEDDTSLDEIEIFSENSDGTICQEYIDTDSWTPWHVGLLTEADTAFKILKNAFIHKLN